MAEIPYTTEALKSHKDRDCVVYTWANMANGDYGTAIEAPGSADKTVQVRGTYGAGGDLRVEGSNLPAPVASATSDWDVLTDPQGNDLAIVSGDKQTEGVLENPRWVRPRVHAGDGTTSLTVRMLVRKR
jgi:hypothetical protein